MALRRAREALNILRRPSTPPPRLSVIVPVYNVGSYLAACLDSVLEQTFEDLEVVMVDDGSTDVSREIAKQYADRSSRIRLFRTGNHGLGAARNLAVHEARGDYLTFVDSDDTVLPEAYARMVETLDQSGSDFVVGTLRRNLAGVHSTPRWQRRLHERRRIGVHIEDFPEILSDVFACNKTFRRDFWDRAGLTFPEGTRYEDQVTLTKAYLSAKAFDVIKRPVYLWRIREDRSSITQRRHEIDDLRERMQTKRESLDIVRRLGSASVQEQFYLSTLAMDLPRYFQHVPDCDAEYWSALHEGLRDLYADAPSWARSALPVEHRLAAWLVMHDRRRDAEAVLDFAARHRPKLPVRREGGEVLAELPMLDDPAVDIPRELYRLQEHEPLALSTEREPS